MKREIFTIFLLVLLLVIILWLLLPPDAKKAYSLSMTEYNQMLKYAKDDNITAIEKLKWHYLVNDKKEIFLFYEYKLENMRNILSQKVYVENDNKTAKYKLELYNFAIEIEKKFYDMLNDNISAMQNFLKDCSVDDFCNHSDIYEYYSQKVKDINENETQ
jgi:hypothetical protein